MRHAALVLVLCACGGSRVSAGWGLRPIGWRGTIPWCERGHVIAGPAYRDADSGIEAVARGTSEVRCADGKIVSITVHATIGGVTGTTVVRD